MIALVTGATGCVGYALCEKLLAHSDFAEVRVLVRGATPDIPAGCRVFVGDLENDAALKTACAGADVVFHAAAQVHSPQAPASDFERVNVVGTANLLHAATLGGVRRVVYCSTVAVYGESTPARRCCRKRRARPRNALRRNETRGGTPRVGMGDAHGKRRRNSASRDRVRSARPGQHGANGGRGAPRSVRVAGARREPQNDCRRRNGCRRCRQRCRFTGRPKRHTRRRRRYRRRENPARHRRFDGASRGRAGIERPSRRPPCRFFAPRQCFLKGRFASCAPASLPA